MEKILAEVKIRRSGECRIPKKLQEILEIKTGDKLAIVFDTDSNSVKLKKVETGYHNFKIEEKIE